MKLLSFFLVIFIVSTMFVSCSSTPTQAENKNPCDEDLSHQDLLIQCHDFAYNSLSSNVTFARAALTSLCEKQELARACSNLAFSYDNPGPSLILDYANSIKFYERGCQLGDGVGCNNLANHYIEGLGTKIDKNKAVTLLQKSCDLNYPMACYRLAVITMRGVLLKNNPQKVAELMIKGCSLGDSISCHDLGYLYIDGNGVAKDPKKAVELFTFACDKGLPRGCGSLGSFYLAGGVVAVDYLKAHELLQKACSGEDAPSCSNLGYMIETGKGSEADPKNAAQYYSKACTAGDSLGCGNLGVLLASGKGVQKNDSMALPKLSIGCADKNPEACRYLAQFHEQGLAKLPRSKETAKFYYLQGCESGDEISCEAISTDFKTLCFEKENNILTCMTGEKRMLSLCSNNSNPNAEILNYRFGRPDKVEMEYNGKMKFISENFGTEVNNRLSFNKGKTQYSISESIIKTSDPAVKKVKIEVSSNGKKINIECHYPILGTLNSESMMRATNLGND
jgi:TPR repeat protein